MWLDIKKHALHGCPGPLWELPSLCFRVLSPLEMLFLEVDGDKTFHVCFPLAHVQPLKWLSCVFSISEATAKDVLGIRKSEAECSKPRSVC